MYIVGTQSNKPPSGKKGKGKGGGTRTPKPSLTAAIQFRDGVDTSKPHWTLRIVTGIKVRDNVPHRLRYLNSVTCTCMYLL